MSTLATHGISRRGLLGAAAGAGALGLLASCSTGTDPNANPSAGTSPDGGPGQLADDFTWPDHDDSWPVAPDLVGSRPEIPSAFLHFPADPPTVNPGPLDFGGKITAFTEVSSIVPPSLGQNPFWQELNSRLGVDLAVTMTPVAEYAQKFQTMIAGGSLPDAVQFKGAPNAPELLDARFQPLTEILAGDGIAKYPNLAKIPTYAWKACVYNNEIYGIPYGLALVPNALFVRRDLTHAAGADRDPADAEDFWAQCREVTDAARGQYALCAPANMLANSIGSMYQVPNNWRVNDDGSWTRHWETDEFAAALEATAAGWQEGLFHPDSLGAPAAKQWFGSGAVVFNQDGLTAISSYRRDAEGDPDFDVTLLRTPLADGSGPAPQYQRTGLYSMTALPKADPERIDQILQLINWLAAPMGTADYLFRVYGIEGEHYTLDGTDPVGNERLNETRVPTSYIGRSTPFIYAAGAPQDAQFQFDYLEAVTPDSVVLPTVGLFSPAQTEIGPDIDRKIADISTDIIAGRKTMADWAPAVAEWKAAGGDTIAAEYAAAAQGS